MRTHLTPAEICALQQAYNRLLTEMSPVTQTDQQKLARTLFEVARRRMMDPDMLTAMARHMYVRREARPN